MKHRYTTRAFYRPKLPKGVLVGTIDLLTHNVGYARRQVGTTPTPKFNFDQNSIQKSFTFHPRYDIEVILPLFKGNILYLLPVVVAEYLYI